MGNGTNKFRQRAVHIAGHSLVSEKKISIYTQFNLKLSRDSFKTFCAQSVCLDDILMYYYVQIFFEIRTILRSSTHNKTKPFEIRTKEMHLQSRRESIFIEADCVKNIRVQKEKKKKKKMVQKKKKKKKKK